MSIYRLYGGDDGLTYMEERDENQYPRRDSPETVSSLTFVTFEVGRCIDRHPAPRRQYGFVHKGTMEIGLGDGTLHRFKPGDILLLENTTGQGHTTRVIGDEPVILALVQLEKIT